MKKLTLTTVALTCFLGMWASPITPEQALARISPSTRAVETPGFATHNLSLKYTARQENGISSAYVFTPAEGEGFIILSADDVAVPVYGYSDSGTFDVNNIPPALTWWLGELSSRVNYAIENNIEKPALKAYAPADMTPVAPLVRTKWDQDAPYYNQTPEINGRHAYTGCVATSFAQAMKYFNYPERGVGSISYYDNGTRRAMNFNRQFSWDLMLDQYTAGNYTAEQADAVAFLMKACGFSVEMMYGRDASGAMSYKLADAAVNYFQYDPSVYFTERVMYTLDEWTRMIYDNIKNIGPVIYDGVEMAGGHSFICDGYDGNGYFHFNWGWSGMSDGYYILDALNPESQGIGASDGGFNRGQGALIGLQPRKEGSTAPYAKMRIYGTVTAELSSNNILFKAVDGGTYTGWGNAAFRTAKFSLGAIFTNIDNPTETKSVDGYYINSSGNRGDYLEIGVSTYYPATSINPVIPVPTLADGNYKVTLASRDVNRADAPLQAMMCNNGSVNYCYLAVNGGKYTVTSASPMYINFVDVTLDTPLYMNRNCRLALEVTNNSAIQLTQGYYPALYRDGRIQYVGDYMLITVDPGESELSQSFTMFKPLADATSTGYGEYQLILVNSADNSVIGYYGNYEMSYVSSQLAVVLNDFAIEGANQQDVQSGSRTFPDVFVLNEANEIVINIDYTVTQGYFDSSLRIVGAAYDPNTNRFTSLDGDVYSEHQFVGQGSENQISTTFSLSGLQAGMVYRLAAGYTEGNSTKTLGTIYFQFNSSGVASIVDESSDNAVYYDLQGRKISYPKPGQLVIEIKGNSSKKVIY